jgi:integrase
MRRINRLTQALCERAMPTEVRVSASESQAAVEGEVLRILRGGGANRAGRLKRVGRLGALASRLDQQPGVIKRRTKYLNDGLGLLLVVSPSPADPDGVRRSWIFRWAGEKVVSKTGKVHRKQLKIGLGSLLTTDLQQARSRATEMRRLVHDRQNPLSIKRGRAAQAKVAEMQLKTLRAAVDEYIRRHSTGWSRKHSLTFKQLFTHLEAILDLPCQSLTTSLIVQALSPFWQAHPESARRLRSFLERVIELAVFNGWREAGQNPAQWEQLRHHFEPRHKLQPVKHHEAMPYGSIASFMDKVREREGVVARALELIILTAVRTSEAILATGDEFNLDTDNPTWTIPWQRTKTGKRTQRPHIVPLSPQAVGCLRRVEVKPAQLVFPTHDRAAYRLAKQIAGEPITAHGFRACFCTWAAEMTDYPREIAEAVLDHHVGNDVERRYRRTSWLDKRRALLREWSDYLDGKSSTADNVVSMRSAPRMNNNVLPRESSVTICRKRTRMTGAADEHRAAETADFHSSGGSDCRSVTTA